MIRVLHAHSDLNWGGIEVWLKNVLEQQPKNTAQFDFIASHVDPYFANAIEKCGGRIFLAPPVAQIPAYVRTLRRVLSQNGRYDVVHSHFVDHSGLVLRTARKMGVSARIAHSHIDLSPIQGNANLVRRGWFYLNRYWVNRHATCGLAASAKAAATLYGAGWRDDPRWQVLPCGIDLAPFTTRGDAAEFRRELRIPNHAFVVGHVGRFLPQKNHRLMLEVIREIAPLRRGIIFLFVGGGPLESWFKRSIEKEGFADAVRILSPRPDVPRLLTQAMDAFIFPSIFEGLGLALVEAQAAGLPCLISDTVPVEADVAPSSVRRLSISAPAADWARELLAMKNGSTIDSRNAFAQVEASPFNIVRSARSLIEKYQELCRPEPVTRPI
jgi:glycosyltransferase involved in cell wall biosynthesis